MKVAFDGRVIADHYPGIGRYAYGLARALGEQTDLTLITNPSAANTRFDLGAIRARRVPVNAGPASLASQWRVPRALARLGADLYHSPYYLMPYGMGRSALAGSNYVLRVAYSVLRFTRYVLRTPQPEPPPVTVATLYDLTPLLPHAGYGAMARLAFRWAHRLAIGAAAKVIVLSRWAKETFAAEFGLDPDRIALIPPGIDPTFHPRPPAEVEAVRARLGLPASYWLAMGSDRPHKNLARLIEAHARLPEAAPPLVVAGARGEASTHSERVRFLGPVAEADLPALYTGARLFVFPSLSEGFGLPVLEAMACGLPVACSTAPGLDEAAGEAAVRFDPHETAALSQTLASLLNDDGRLAARRAASRQHAARFTWERAAQATLEAYAQALGK